MSGIIKGMLIALMIVYIVSPVDLCPGPIDDIIVLLFGVCGSATTKAIEQ